MPTLLRKPEITLPLLLLLLGTLLFRTQDWDLAWADRYHSPEEGWSYKVSSLWMILYRYGSLPAILCTIFAFILFMLGIWHPLRKYRKIALYLMSFTLLGPGLLVNGVLKEYWGRPRPKQISKFGGPFDFEPLLTMDFNSTGKSFPCGHATMGFFFFALAYALRHWSKKAAILTGLFALLYGTAIGYARLTQGGHFPSDTLWSAGLCWFTATALYYAFRLHHSPYLLPSIITKRPWWMLPAMTLGILTITFLTALATPYDKTRSYSLQDLLLVKKILIYSPHPVTIHYGQPELHFTSHGEGHRLPKSHHRIVVDHTNTTLSITIKKTGLFTELNLTNTISLPKGILVETLESRR